MMKLAKRAFLIVAASAFSAASYAYNDPQTDFDSLYAIESGSQISEQEVVDIAVLETVSSDAEYRHSVDPQTDFDSVHE